MKTTAAIAALGVLLLFQLPARQQVNRHLPTVTSASVPFYPRLAPTARIEGVVVLRLTTDGQRVSAINGETGPPMLVAAAKENVQSWQFEPHSPATIEVEFRYRLLVPKCNSDCNCDTEERESVVLHLPTDIEVTAKIPAICDPAVPLKQQGHK